MKDLFLLNNPFLYVGLFLAFFWGIRCLFVFVKEEERKKMSFSEKLHQFFLNGVGAFTGAVALSSVWDIPMVKRGIDHSLVLMIAFLGVTGHLPYATLIGRLPK